ncbi:hypothetical protein B9Z19DRAFT_1112118 [Tuber borchii]|uniref:N-acetyltransferase domain-containing protein n=1 Tax=Tuber borchii TaxID=42251 RepID=A0A2T7A894_TUBBO|nr:hypothetical protein B9Z19DRAFT_1112118 [Tuber borchii]
MAVIIREYQEGDFGDVVEICKLTAHPSIQSSADILPYIYAVPYIRLEPAHAFVLDAGSSEENASGSGSGSGRRVVGYIIGTPDTKTFVERYRREYLPTLTLPSAVANITATSVAAQVDDGDGDGDELQRMFEKILLNPEEMLQPAAPDFIPCYPAHLHIDILPEFQGKGFGGRLMEKFLRGMRQSGGGACGGVHLGMRRDNVAAGRFYKRCGFRVHEGLSDEHTTWMVKDLEDLEGEEGEREDLHDTRNIAREKVDRLYQVFPRMITTYQQMFP